MASIDKSITIKLRRFKKAPNAPSTNKVVNIVENETSVIFLAERRGLNNLAAEQSSANKSAYMMLKNIRGLCSPVYYGKKRGVISSRVIS